MDDQSQRGQMRARAFRAIEKGKKYIELQNAKKARKSANAKGGALIAAGETMASSYGIRSENMDQVSELQSAHHTG